MRQRSTPKSFAFLRLTLFFAGVVLLLLPLSLGCGEGLRHLAERNVSEGVLPWVAEGGGGVYLEVICKWKRLRVPSPKPLRTRGCFGPVLKVTLAARTVSQRHLWSNLSALVSPPRDRVLSFSFFFYRWFSSLSSPLPRLLACDLAAGALLRGSRSIFHRSPYFSAGRRPPLKMRLLFGAFFRRRCKGAKRSKATTNVLRTCTHRFAV